MKFQPERFIQLRNSLNINKAEAARRLNISPMVYGRYENGQREPSYPTVGFIAQTFNCNIDFLYGTSDKTDPDYIIVSSSNDPELYSLIKMIKQDSNVEGRILTYVRKLLEKQISMTIKKGGVYKLHRSFYLINHNSFSLKYHFHLEEINFFLLIH